MESTLTGDRLATDRLASIRGQFQEMPGLHLTLVQARRLFGLDERTSRTLLAALVEDRFLAMTAAGAYVRADMR